jgi:hypothetical protein
MNDTASVFIWNLTFRENIAYSSFNGHNVHEHILNPEDEDTTLPQNDKFHHSLMRRHIPGEEVHHNHEV